MRVHYPGGICISKKDNRRLWWYCSRCGKGRDMVIVDEFYDEPTYRVEVCCVNCGKTVFIGIDDLINATYGVEWSD